MKTTILPINQQNIQAASPYGGQLPQSQPGYAVSNNPIVPVLVTYQGRTREQWMQSQQQTQSSNVRECLAE
jgi:hypothetical protein